MCAGRVLPILSDRLPAVAFVLMVAVALAGIVTNDTTASFTGSSTNPSNQAVTLLVQPPAGQNAPTSSAAGVVNLSWTATPTAPGTGHTLSYDVLRGPVGGPYAFVKNVSTLATTDTPSSDGTYEYVIQAKVSGVGTFNSANSTAKSGMSDRTAPTAATAVTSTSGASGAPVTVDLSWTAATDALSGVSGYEVRWTNAGASPCPAQNTTNFPNSATIGALTTYQISGLASGSFYCAYLVTIDNAGNRSTNSATAGPTKAK